MASDSELAGQAHNDLKFIKGLHGIGMETNARTGEKALIVYVNHKDVQVPAAWRNLKTVKKVVPDLPPRLLK